MSMTPKPQDSKTIESALVELFMAGRKSAFSEIETKGKAIQIPIVAQTAEATKIIESLVIEAYKKGYVDCGIVQVNGGIHNE